MPSDGEQITPAEAAGADAPGAPARDSTGEVGLPGLGSTGDAGLRGIGSTGDFGLPGIGSTGEVGSGGIGDRASGAVGNAAERQAGNSAVGVESAVGGAEFHLEEGARKELTRAQLVEWEKIYQTGGRQLRRWWNEGAPLADAAAMPIWWEKERAAGRKSWGVPAKITAAARAAKDAAVEKPAAGVPEASDAATGARSQGGTTGAPRVIPLLTLADLEFDDSEVVRNAARRVRALDIRVEAAYAGKSGEDVDYLQGLLTKAAEALRKLQDSEQKRKVLLGAFVPKAAVERDLATLVELLRQMDETEVRRVAELCPSMTVEVKAQVAAAIMRVGAARRRIFRSLGALKSAAGALAELAAA